MKRTKFCMLILIILLFPLDLCGCWNYREIDTLGIVTGLAVDKDMKTNKYVVTIEIIYTQTEGNAPHISSEIYTTEGDSIFDGIRNIIGKTSLRLYWSHAKTIIVSKEVAKIGLIPVIDWINRDSELRPDMWILISKSSTAGEILKHKTKLNEVVSLKLDEGMKSEKTISKYTDSALMSLIDGLASEGRSATIATVENESIDDNIASNINGCGILKADKLVGFLNGKETLYYLMIRSKIKEGIIVLKNVSNSGTDVTLELFGNKTKLTPAYYKGAPSITIDVYPTFGIAEVGGTTDFMKEENIKKLQAEGEKKLTNELQHLINKLQLVYDSDIFGFEELFKKNKPKLFDKLKKSGIDIFSAIKTNVHVHIAIKGSGKTIKPILKDSQ